ncbi:MAG: rubrerythrin [Oscillibacter sp.]|nr:rubrerythrin [Oscillibacter sp.]
MSIEHTKTAENLRKALAGESIARNKYTYFAQAAQANGDEEVAAAFEQMAKNEMMHAKFWFEQLYGKPSDTKECLAQAAQGEYSEWHDMYPDFARQAREEGLEELAVMFEKVAAIEQSHENRFLSLLAKMSKPSDPAPAAKASSPAPRQKKEGYRCQFCGAIFERRPDVCDTCGAIGAFDYVEYYE